MSKFAAVLFLAFLPLLLFPTQSSAQLLPSGNVYAGVGYADNVDVVNRLGFRGWEGSVEMFPFHHLTYVGIALDGSGFYRTGVTQYNIVLGPRLSMHYGKWRPFVHALGGIQFTNSSGQTFTPIVIDAGAGVDRKLPFKNFSWRLQFDYAHTHLLSEDQNDFRGTTGLVWRF
ncbi:MAG: hypothetical protein ACLQLC_01335 [Candidatus Sulfotelmatobacter sp.]